MADIIYRYGKAAYLNITNQCPCACTFCIRNNADALGSAKNLWHETEPTLGEIISAIDNYNFTDESEIVFCGYGEPCCRLDALISAAQHIKQNYSFKIRLNTNGLSDLINERATAKEICENVDFISISLNAPNKQQYQAIVNSAYGEAAFDAMLRFAAQCRELTENVRFTVVDTIGAGQIAQCVAIADEMGIKIKIRSYEK